jgi:hypothetical protein
MIPEFFNYIMIFQIASLLIFYKAYDKRDEILWVISTVLSGALVFILYTVDTHFVIIAILNIGIFLISIVYFFIDLFANHSFEWLLFRRKKE